MKFGLHLNSSGEVGEQLETRVQSLIEQTRQARIAGFDFVGTGHHYLLNKPKAQAIPLLGRLAAESGDMTVFTSVFILPLHHPVEVAEQTTTLATLADDVVLGVGAGYRDTEFDNFGIRKAERGGRIEESIEILNKLWTEEAVEYEGEFYSIPNATINPRPKTKPEIWYGGNSVTAVKRAARVSDSWYPIPTQSLKQVQELKTVYDEARDSSTPSEIPLIRECFVAPTTEQAHEITRQALTDKYEGYIRRNVDEHENMGLDEVSDSADEFERFARDRFIIGSPEEAISEIRKYERELNVSHMVFRIQWPGISREETVTCIERLGEDVLPYV